MAVDELILLFSRLPHIFTIVRGQVPLLALHS